MRKAIIKLVNLVVLLCAVAWLCRSPGWEPLVVSLGLLASFIGLELRGLRRAEDDTDRKLFRAFLKALPYEGSINYVRDTDMGGMIQSDKLDQLATFAAEWRDAAHEFQTRRLERKRKKLVALAREYLLFMSLNTWSERPGWSRVPPEWRIEQRERYLSVVEKLHKLGTEIVNCHQDLVRAAQKKLNVTGTNAG